MLFPQKKNELKEISVYWTHLPTSGKDVRIKQAENFQIFPNNNNNNLYFHTIVLKLNSLWVRA